VLKANCDVDMVITDINMPSRLIQLDRRV